MLTPFANTIELALELTGDKQRRFASHTSSPDGKPWSLMNFHGWISVHEVNIRTGTYFLNIYRLLVRLEELTEPRKQFEEATQGLAAIGTLTPLYPALREPLVHWIVVEVQRVEDESRDLGLGCTAKRLGHLRDYLNENEPRLRASMDFVGDAGMQTELRVLRQALTDDLDDRIIFFPELEKIKKYHGTLTSLFGAETLGAFRPANRDILSAHNCYICDEATASVFHSMRSAEWGLRAIILHFDPAAKPEDLTWGLLIGYLDGKIKKLLDKNPNPPPDWQAKLDFYSEALAQGRFFKRWRDDVMHTRKSFEEAEALQMLTHMREFLQLLTRNGVSLPEQIR